MWLTEINWLCVASLYGIKCLQVEESGELLVEQLLHMCLQWFNNLRGIPINQPQRQVLRCRPHRMKWKCEWSSQCWADFIYMDLSNTPQSSEHAQSKSQWWSIITSLVCQPADWQQTFEHQDLDQHPAMDKEFRGGGVCVLVCVCMHVCACVCMWYHLL